MIEAKDDERFLNEAGIHTIQRVPPTESRGRVHTSCVKVSVLYNKIKVDENISDKDFEIRFYSGTGKGGQRRNRVLSCCTVTHLPSGLSQNANGRSRIDNEAEAKRLLREKLLKHSRKLHSNAINKFRQDQLEMVRRTYRFRDDLVIDHETGKQTTCKKFMRGEIEVLW